MNLKQVNDYFKNIDWMDGEWFHFCTLFFSKDSPIESPIWVREVEEICNAKGLSFKYVSVMDSGEEYDFVYSKFFSNPISENNSDLTILSSSPTIKIPYLTYLNAKLDWSGDRKEMGMRNMTLYLSDKLMSFASFKELFLAFLNSSVLSPFISYGFCSHIEDISNNDYAIFPMSSQNFLTETNRGFSFNQEDGGKWYENICGCQDGQVAPLQQALEAKQLHLSGKFRHIDILNVLTDLHAQQVVGGVKLIDWINSDPMHGYIELIKPNLYLWEVPKDCLDAVQTVMYENNLLIAVKD